MSADIGHISELLNATLNPAEHRKGAVQTPAHAAPRSQTSPANICIAAEAALKQASSKPQYSLALLNIVNSNTLPPNTRLSAALAFKNFIRTSYVVRLPPADRRHSRFSRKLNASALG
jgi:exportin-2 (importin alpha re-exporter)